MTTQPFQWSEDWTFGFKIWLNRAGHTVLGQGRFDLLAAIDRTSSISAAARELGMSYRHAWLLVHETNERAGVPLVEAATGGRQGGGARLTHYGRQAIDFFQRLSSKVGARAADAVGHALTAPSESSCVHLLAATSMQEVVGQVLADYSLRHPCATVRSIFGASNELADQVLGGMTADLFLSADRGQLERLQHVGLIAEQTQRVLAVNGLAALAGRGNSVAVRRPQDLLGKRAWRIVLADPQTPLGMASVRYLEHVGIYEQLLERAMHVDNARAVLSALRSGCADIGLAFGSEAATNSQCRVLFRTRAPCARTRYVGAVLSGSQCPEAARSLLDFFHGASARSAFRRCGFQLASERSAKQTAAKKRTISDTARS